MAVDTQPLEEVIIKAIIHAVLVLTCTMGTGVFMAYHHDIYGAYPALCKWQVIWHCLPQHLTVTGYVMALPWLLELLLPWLPGRRYPRWHSRLMSVYLPVMCGLLLLGWAVNDVLYGYWGIVLDSTAIIYVKDNPSDAIAEAPWWSVVLTIVMILSATWTVWRVMQRLYVRRSKIAHPWRHTLLALLVCTLDFLTIRGGWTASTMNPGEAYFSSEMPLNHAAVDPVFNLLYSLGKNQRFDQQYRFMTDEEADAALAELKALGGDQGEACRDTLLRCQRPDILLVLLESFSGTACHYLTPEADEDWMPSVNQMMREGVAFTRFYANSFRTDRGVAAVLAAYPGQPTNSVMKDQAKCENLDYLTLQLKDAGYRLQFIHGGDVNFTNMQGFLHAGGIDDIVGDTDFPLSERLDKWGVRDDRMTKYTADRLTDERKDSVPCCTILLSLSSHEPFEVPYHHFDDPYLNSVAYADSCLGGMIAQLKAAPKVWERLLVIGLPDHCYARFPADIQQHEPRRYHIPMFWTGGAVREHCEINVLGQQTDLTATLLSQLGIEHSRFAFSKDMTDPSIAHYAFYAFSDGLGLLTDSCSYIQDNCRDGIGLQPGTDDPHGKAQRWGKAYLQRLYDDLAGR